MPDLWTSGTMSFYCRECKEKPNPRKIDGHMQKFVLKLRLLGIHTKGSCCGHNKYPVTIVCYNSITDNCYEFFSSTLIPRKARFYKKDKAGYFYIPEVSS